MTALNLLGIVLLFQYATCTEYTIICPKAFRIGSSQSVIVNLHGYQRATIELHVQNPVTTVRIAEASIIVTGADINLPVKLLVNIPQEISEFPSDNLFLFFLRILDSVPSTGNNDTAFRIFLSGESGYLFASTDQPVYKPGDDVKIKVFTMDQSMRETDLRVQVVVRAPPDGVGVYKKTQTMRSGKSFLQVKYKIDENPVIGIWKVEAIYDYLHYQTKTETSFLIEKYVLPMFQVTIVPDRSNILVTDEEISGTIYANFSFGEPVYGNVYIAMKLKKTPTSTPIKFYDYPNKTQSAVIADEGFRFTVRIRDTLLNPLTVENETLESLQGSGASVLIEASVRESGTGVIESAIFPHIPIILSSYVIDTKRTTTYYIPGLIYPLKADIYYTNGNQPASRVPYEILVNNVLYQNNEDNNERRTEINGQINADINLIRRGRHMITIRTRGNGQAIKTFHVDPYRSTTSSYLKISLSQQRAYSVGDRADINFGFNQQNITEIRYVIVARGSIVYSSSVADFGRNHEGTANVNIIQNMVPSARIVAYYIFNNEVVSNSLWFDVADQCKTELEYDMPSQISPGDRELVININGARNALVSTIAIDRAAYFLYNESRLTRQKMFGKMESYDQGCTRNGGADTPGVFSESGLTIHTADMRPRVATTLNCSAGIVRARKKRQAEASVPVLDNYIENLLNDCELDGSSEAVLPGDTCEKRRDRCQVNFDDVTPECAERFYNACVRAERERYNDILFNGIGRSLSDEAAQLDKSVKDARKNFESNMIKRSHIKLSRSGRGQMSVSTPHSITTFEVDGVSLANEENGFCVSHTKTIRVFKKIFIKVITPYALKKREQANIRVAVYNYGDEEEPLPVILYVMPPSDEILCTRYQTGSWNTLISFDIQPKRSFSTILTVLPLKIPDNIDGTTEIHFQVGSQLLRNHIFDKVTKKVKIEESGEVQNKSGSFSIDLTDPRNPSQQEIINILFDIPPKIVPETKRCWLYAYSSFLGPSIEVNEVTQEPQNVRKFIRMPKGCGEQNMVRSAPNVYVLMYLVASGKVEPYTIPYDRLIQQIMKGYEIELTHRSDTVQRKAFSVFARFPPSVWLTAFVVKVFSKAKEYAEPLDTRPICISVEWLLDREMSKGETGEFIEWRQPGNRAMHGGVGGSLTLTVYVVISMLEARARCQQALMDAVSATVTNSINYLKNNENSTTLNETYPLALFAYALALHNQPDDALLTDRVFNRLQAKKITQGGLSYWKDKDDPTSLGNDWFRFFYPLAIDIEATAYALLALVTRTRRENIPPAATLQETRQIVLWLIKQRNDGGAFRTTQDTVVGLQALATYQMWIDSVTTFRIPTNFTISFTAPGTVWNQDDIRLTDADLRYRKEVSIPKKVADGRHVTATVRGFGEGMLSYRCTYRTVVDENSCHFNITKPTLNVLNTEQEEEIEEGNKPARVKITFTVRKFGNSTKMSIIEVGMMSGFVPKLSSVRKLSISDAVDGIVDRFEISDDRVVFYVSEITEKPLTIAFEMEQQVLVKNPEPAKINVYDYYQTTIRCGIFYSMRGVSHLFTSNCNQNNELCRCAEGGCLKCRTRDEQVSKTICLDKDVNAHCDTCEGDNCFNLWSVSCLNNYAYETEVIGIMPPVEEDIFYNVTARITKVLREGEDPNAEANKTISILVRKDCLENCNDGSLRFPDRSRNEISNMVRPGIRLFIAGPSPELISGNLADRDSTLVYQYYLDEKSVIDRIISAEKRRKYRRKCKASNRDTPRCIKLKQLSDGFLAYKAFKKIMRSDGCE